MTDKVLYSVSSLKNWSDKILLEVGHKKLQLRHFRLDYSMDDYMRFYQELLPYLENLAISDPEMFGLLVSKYKENSVLLEEGMKENWLTQMLSRTLFDLPVYGRNTNDLIEAIRQVKLNTENLEYSLKLNL